MCDVAEAITVAGNRDFSAPGPGNDVPPHAMTGKEESDRPWVKILE
jgi:hypothetical protein